MVYSTGQHIITDRTQGRHDASPNQNTCRNKQSADDEYKPTGGCKACPCFQPSHQHNQYTDQCPGNQCPLYQSHLAVTLPEGMEPVTEGKPYGTGG